jgi:hypothetical protein
MLYHLINLSGKYTFVGYDEAKKLVSSGQWSDITKYEESNHGNERQQILEHPKCQTEEPTERLCGESRHQNLQDKSSELTGLRQRVSKGQRRSTTASKAVVKSAKKSRDKGAL